jgi:two-component system chemotaxis sensor kinase CheA
MNLGDYKESFLIEAREYLSALNNSLVLLEKDQTRNEAIHEIFRAAHTLKGMAATMGYDPMVRLTHQIETVLEPVRSGIRNLSTGMVDVLFTCLDQLEKWVEDLTSQDFIEEDNLESLLRQLELIWKDKPDSTENTPEASTSVTDVSLRFSESEKEILSQATMNGFSIFEIYVQLSADCVFKEVRAFMILKKVNEL